MHLTFRSAPRRFLTILTSGMIAANVSAESVPCGFQLLTETTVTSGDGYGSGVAVVGDLALVGCKEADGPHPASGLVFAYQFNGDPSDPHWSAIQVIAASDAANEQNAGRFGYAIAADVHDGAPRAIVGATYADSVSSNTGAAYVFTHDGSAWTERQKLRASDAGPGDFFGYSVAVSGDLAVIGAPTNDDAGTSSGSAYVFYFNGSAWNQVAKLTAADAAAGDEFGLSVAIRCPHDAGPDCFIVVGAPGDDDSASNAGSAYYFGNDGPASWFQLFKLTPGDPVANGRFGASAAISRQTDEESNEILIGASGAFVGVWRPGAVYTFRWDFEQGNWMERQKFAPPGVDIGDDEFGRSIAINGSNLLVGAPQFGSRGMAFVFSYEKGLGEGWWTQQATLAPTGSGASGSDHFGTSVAIDADALLVGHPSRKQVNAYTLSGPDVDADDVLDVCDNCPLVQNLNQSDVDGDTVGDLCDDEDADGVLDIDDNCPFAGNPDQSDDDDDGFGDACEVSIVHGATGVSFDDHAFTKYIDPRVESSNGVDRDLGLDRFVIVFTEPVRDVGGSDLTAASFSATETGNADPPYATAVETTDRQTVTVILNRIITLREWTTIIARVESDSGVPIGSTGDVGPGFAEYDRIDVAFLPANIDQNTIINPLDVLRFKQYVAGVVQPQRGIVADYLDMDRNGAVTPLDLLWFKRMINGISPPSTHPGNSMNHSQP